VHLPTKTRVAVKIIDIRNEKARERAYHEVSVLKIVGQHKHVVTLQDTEADQDSLYLFMEYAAGGDVYSYIEKNGPLSETISRSVLRQVTSALEYCHSKGVVHHDVKLENMLLLREFEVLLSDFGFSQYYQQVADGEQRKGLTSFSGSPLYLAPEVFALQEHDEQVDVWSLGISLYYMLVGSFPFLANTIAGLEEAVTLHEVKFTQSMNVPPHFQDLIRSFLSKDPSKRTHLPALKHLKWLYEDARPPFLPTGFPRA